MKVRAVFLVMRACGPGGTAPIELCRNEPLVSNVLRVAYCVCVCATQGRRDCGHMQFPVNTTFAQSWMNCPARHGRAKCERTEVTEFCEFSGLSRARTYARLVTSRLGSGAAVGRTYTLSCN